MEDAALLDAYLTAPGKRAALRRMMVTCEAEGVERLQKTAVQRYARGTLTLTELKLFAHDLAAVCPRQDGQRLYLALSSARECCVRNANIEARQLLQDWLTS